MDYVKSVTFVTEDEKWIEKIGLGALWTLLCMFIVGIFPLAGWMMEGFRRAANGHDEPLPGWGNLGDYFRDGARLIAIGFLWSIPVAIITAVTGGLGSILGLVSSFLMLGSMAILAMTDDFRAALDPRNAWKVLKDNLNDWIVAALVMWALSAVAGLIGSIACGIGVFVTVPWALIATAYIAGKAYAESGVDVYNLDAAPAAPAEPFAATVQQEPVVTADAEGVVEAAEQVEPVANAVPRIDPVASSASEAVDSVTRKLEDDADAAMNALNEGDDA